MKEAISAGITCGEILMDKYRKLLQFQNEKKLCYNAIITQRHFCNTIHKDKNSVLSSSNQKKILGLMGKLKDEKEYDKLDSYMKLVLQQNENKLPKSTTCCWKLVKSYSCLKLQQFFVAPENNFCINLSSDVMSVKNGVGATFYSSMFYHVTSVPVWQKGENKITLKGPSDMYNFDWGSDGGNREKD